VLDGEIIALDEAAIRNSNISCSVAANRDSMPSICYTAMGKTCAPQRSRPNLPPILPGLTMLVGSIWGSRTC